MRLGHASPVRRWAGIGWLSLLGSLLIGTAVATAVAVVIGVVVSLMPKVRASSEATQARGA